MSIFPIFFFFFELTGNNYFRRLKVELIYLASLEGCGLDLLGKLTLVSVWSYRARVYACTTELIQTCFIIRLYTRVEHSMTYVKRYLVNVIDVNGTSYKYFL